MKIFLEIDSKELHLLLNSIEKDIYMANSQWLTDVLASILTIAQGNAGDPALQAKVAALTAQIGTDEGNAAVSNAEFKTAIAALVKQLAAAPPPVGPVPVVSSISLASGSINGGEKVVITGNFPGALVVHYGAVAAPSFTQDSDTQVTAVSPAQAAGKVDITVTTPGGVSAIVPADVYTLA